MRKMTRNQAMVAFNPYQGRTKKVLIVCSAGVLRGPTAANVIHEEYGYNTRSCGYDQEYALIPLSEVLLQWADEIVFVEQDAYVATVNLCTEFWGQMELEKQITILDIPDDYMYDQTALKNIISQQYEEKP